VAALEGELAEAVALAENERSADGARRMTALSQQHQLAMDALRGIAPARISELAKWVANQVLERVLTGGGS
jgi:hypothetical protein